LERWVRVERSLYERANGYSYEAVKIFMPAGSKQPVVVHYTEHCPPDVGAAPDLTPLQPAEIHNRMC
jgi:hypothetical protein